MTGIDYPRLYEYRLRGISQRSRQAVWNEIAAYLYRRMGAPARVLDVGAGRGEFITAVPAAERWALDAVDLVPSRGEIRVIGGGIMDADLPDGYSMASWFRTCWSTCPRRTR